MTGSAEQLQKQAPTREKAIELVDKLEADGEAYDANGSSEDLSDEERVAQLMLGCQLSHETSTSRSTELLKRPLGARDSSP